MKIIGITGTNGKTSTTQFIYQMLTGMGRKAAVVGTLGIKYDGEEYDVGLTTPTNEVIMHHMGRMLAVGVEYLVMEVSSHSLAQDRVRGVKFDVGVFTNLTQDHLDYHGGFEAYKAAKHKLMDMSDSMVFNVDDPVGEEFFHEYMSKGGKCVNISTACNCTDVTADNISGDLYGSDFTLNFFGTRAHIHINIPGRFSVYNALSAFSVLHLLGFSFEEIIDASAEIKSVPGRAQILDIDEDFTIMIDYAHTPDALMNILSAIREVFDGRVITLFGCGGDRDRKKRPLMAAVAAEYSDFVYLTSDNPRTEDPMRIITDALPSLCTCGKPYRVIVNREEAITYAVKSLAPGELLLIAGKGHEKYQIVGEDKLPFDEEKIVRKALIF